MTDYTPGPWKVYHQLLRPQFPGHKIIEVQNLDGGPVIPWAGFDNIDVGSKKRRLANARLIAQAPELLESLQELLPIISEMRGLPEKDGKPCSELCGNAWCNEFGCIPAKLKRARAALKKSPR